MPDDTALLTAIDVGARAIDLVLAHHDCDADRVNVALSYLHEEYGDRAAYAAMLMLAKAVIPPYEHIVMADVVGLDEDGVSTNPEDMPAPARSFMSFIRAVDAGDLTSAELVWREVFASLDNAEPDEEGVTHATPEQAAFLGALLRAVLATVSNTGRMTVILPDE